MKLDQFWSNARIVSADDCWAWTGKDKQVSVREWNRKTNAPWVAWTIHFGEPKGFVAPTCKNRMCVNPAHLVDLGDVRGRFNRQVDIRGVDECWPWMGSRVPKGYGKFGITSNRRARMVIAHRVAWEFANGPIPRGMLVCHRCDNPPCCNPAHLFLGSAADNSRDAYVKGRLKIPGWKLSPADAADIRATHRRGRGVNGSAHLARRYGVTSGAINAVIAGRTWTP